MTKAQILREVQELPTDDQLELAAMIREAVVAEPASEGALKTRWQVVAEQLDQQGFLDGKSDEAKKLLRQGRFAF